MENQTSEKKSGVINPLLIVGGVALLGVIGAVVMLMQGNKTNSVMTETNTNQTDSLATESMTSEKTVDESTMEASGTMSEGEIRIVEVEAGSFYYKPNIIRVKKGETVRIVMTSKDMMHDFNIDELGVDMPVTQSGTTAEVEFTVDQAGEFEFYCSVGQHRQNGQVGTLIVEE